MKEYLTEAIVLSLRPHKEHDCMADIYTKDFGRLEVKVTAGRKILSKLSPHLDVGNLIMARLVEKSQLTLVDALAENRFQFFKSDLKKAVFFFRLLFLFRTVLPRAVPDLPFWYFFSRSLREGKTEPESFLKLLGYNPEFAECDNCEGGRAEKAESFHILSQTFLCDNCSSIFLPQELLFYKPNQFKNYF